MMHVVMRTRAIGRVLTASTIIPSRSQTLRLPLVIHESSPPPPRTVRKMMVRRSFASSSSGGGQYTPMTKQIAIVGVAGLAVFGCTQIMSKEMNSNNGDDAASQAVVVETISPGAGPQVTTDHIYRSIVTLYIEEDDKFKTPSGWSTRKEDGADSDETFEFQPGVNLIEGWSQGVLEMKEGERALLHVPSSLGYGNFSVGSQGGAFYVPANSNLLFDIEVLGKKEKRKKKKKKRGAKL